MGPLWVGVFLRLCLEQMSIIDVQQSMLTFSDNDQSPKSIIDNAINIILSKVKNCRKAKKVESYIEDDDNIADPFEITPESYYETKERANFMNAIFTAIIGTKTDSIELGENIKKVIQNFQKKLELSTEERLFLKTIYQTGYTIDNAGKMFDWSSDQAHGKLTRIKKRLRTTLEETGLTKELMNFIKS